MTIEEIASHLGAPPIVSSLLSPGLGLVPERRRPVVPTPTHDKGVRRMWQGLSRVLRGTGRRQLVVGLRTVQWVHAPVSVRDCTDGGLIGRPPPRAHEIVLTAQPRGQLRNKLRDGTGRSRWSAFIPWTR